MLGDVAAVNVRYRPLQGFSIGSWHLALTRYLFRSHPGDCKVQEGTGEEKVSTSIVDKGPMWTCRAIPGVSVGWLGGIHSSWERGWNLARLCHDAKSQAESAG